VFFLGYDLTSLLSPSLARQEERPSSTPLAALGAPGVYQEHGTASTTLHDLGGYIGQGAGEVEPEPVPGPTTTDPTHDYHSGGGNSLMVADLQGEVPLFCWVGRCQYWHTDRKQIKRHRDIDFPGIRITSRSSAIGLHFRYKDAVVEHCRKVSKRRGIQGW